MAYVGKNVSSFTPVLKFGGGSTGITYSQQLAQFYAVGSMVFFTVLITLSNKGSSTGNATIAGLPFTADGLETFFPVYGTNVTPSLTYTYMGGEIIGGSTEITLFQGAPPLQTQLNETHFANNSALQISGFYLVN